MNTIYKMRTYLIVLISILTMSKISSQNDSGESLKEFLANKGYYTIALEKNIAGHLVVNVEINDVKGNFILDTGASTTVIHNEREHYFKLNVDKNSASNEGAGAGANNITVMTSKNNIVELVDYKIENFDIALMNLEHVNIALKQLGEQEEIDGVIGADVLKISEAVIDYSNLVLYLKTIKND